MGRILSLPRNQAGLPTVMESGPHWNPMGAYAGKRGSADEAPATSISSTLLAINSDPHLPPNVENSEEPEISNRVLVAQTRLGDEQAARALLDRLYPLVLKLVRAYRARRTGEEDLCQMIFIRIFHSLHQYSGTVPLEHWVSRIAINTCLKQIESERIRPEIRCADLSEEQEEVIAQLASSTADLPGHQRAAAREVVHFLLSQLEPKERLIISLLHLEDRTIEEIKALTGWNSSIIKVRAFRARHKLKRLYLKLLSTQR